ncbi:MAG TPA: hypothetical protein VLH77_01935, partial [Gammaproteobacteria bacterium]|nr:hypothetical protein [Gammaproteobacteria bacterium]
RAAAATITRAPQVRKELESIKKELMAMAAATFDFSKPQTDLEKINFGGGIWTAERNRLKAIDKLRALIISNNLVLNPRLQAEFDAIYTIAEDAFDIFASLDTQTGDVPEETHLGYGKTIIDRAHSSMSLSNELLQKAIAVTNFLLTGALKEQPPLLQPSDLPQFMRIRITLLKKALETPIAFDAARATEHDLIQAKNIAYHREKRVNLLLSFITYKNVAVDQKLIGQLKKQQEELMVLNRAIARGLSKPDIKKALDQSAATAQTAIRVINSLGI